MLNPIKEICKWQIDAGNVERPYNDKLEAAFQIEEALEGFKDLPYLATRLHFEQESHKENFNPKQISRQIVNLASMDDKTPISDVDRLDKACDAIVFAIGSMQKLGLDYHGIVKALNIVNSANKVKLGAPRDSMGKLGKPDNWEKFAPEVHLAKLLEEFKK